MPPKNFKCKQFGNCCLNLNDAFQASVSDEDIALWEIKGRYDILEWVNSISLGEEYYIHDIWVNPKQVMMVAMKIFWVDMKTKWVEKG